MFAPPPRPVNVKAGSSVPVSDPDEDEYIREYKNARVQTSWLQDSGLFLNGETFDKWVEFIRRAKKTIRIIIYTFAEMTLAKDLLKRKKEGIKIQICMDRSSYEQHAKRSPNKGVAKIFKMLADGGVDIRLVDGFTLERSGICTIWGGFSTYSFS